MMHNGDRTTEWRESCFGRPSKYFVWMVIKIFCLDSHQNILFGRSSKYFVWTVVKICRLDGCQNLSFGRSAKFILWTVGKIFHFNGRQNSSFGRSSKFIDWTVVKICRLEGRQKTSRVQAMPLRWEPIPRKTLLVHPCPKAHVESLPASGGKGTGNHHPAAEWR